MTLVKARSRGINLADNFAFTGTITGAGGGKVLQVVSTKITGERSTNNTSYLATNLVHTITPASSSNKVLCMFTLPSIYGHNRSRVCRIKIYRHSASITVGQAPSGTEVQAEYHSCYLGGSDMQTGKSAYTFLDSPSSSSAVYYQVYHSVSNTDCNSYIGQGGTPECNITLMEIDA
tara:strand:+ start:14 stop:541 length:528 start_codon:yes stop_codon:yes gene_type:complete